MSSSRESCAAGAFSEEEGRLHDQGIARIGADLAAGLSFDEACAGLEVADAELRRIIIDDYLKVTIAERHFREGHDMGAVAQALRIPVERVNRAREEMIEEISRAAAEVFRKQSGGFPPDGPH